MAQKLISFDLRADFGFFKKPDVNDGLVMGYNMLHRPALLGLLGAIAGLRGYERRGELPDYYEKLRPLRLSIAPLDGCHDKGNFSKTNLKYTNTVGYANKDEFGKGTTQIIEEQTLIAPAYRVYLLLDLDDATQAVLYRNIRAGEAVYLPYFGKNEHAVWWDTEGKNGVVEYEFSDFDATKGDFRIASVFIRKDPLRDQEAQPDVFFSEETLLLPNSFLYFERLPIGFEQFQQKAKAKASGKTQQASLDFGEAEPAPKGIWEFQYQLADFAYTNWLLKPKSVLDSLFEIRRDGQSEVIQLF
jgi:CRISPR-associated protein Cas5h